MFVWKLTNFICILFVLLGLASGPVFANVVGADAQNFNPITSGLDFVTVQSSETLASGVYNFGLFANYAKNSLPFYDDAAGGAKRDSSLTGGDLNVGVGLLKNWDAGLSFPVILQQTVSDTSSTGHYSSKGNTEIRVNTKYRLFGSQSQGLALVGSVNFNRIANNPYVGAGGGPIYNLELAADTAVGNVAMALNLGYRFRHRGEAIPLSGVEPLVDQMLASGALSYLFEPADTKIVFEIVSAFPQSGKMASDREYSVLESLLGLKYDSNSNVSIHLGGGAALIKGIASPDLRIYSGINMSFGSIRTRGSAQTDPYSVKRPHKLRRTGTIKAVPYPSEAKVKTARQGPPKLPPPPAEVAQALVESSPAKSAETISDVKVFNRGSINHIVLNNLEFVGRTMNLKPESERYLMSELLPALRELNRRRPVGSIVVEGHTDSIGGEASNRPLSEQRAELVGRLLRAHLEVDIPIQTVGLGASSPIADNGNYQGRALNRRVEIRVLYRATPR